MREAPSRVIIDGILKAGGRVKAYDPEAAETARREFPSSWFEGGAVAIAEAQYDVLEGADALILATEWKVFRTPDLEQLARHMKQKIVFDGRNQYNPEKLREAGFAYYGIGR